MNINKEELIRILSENISDDSIINLSIAVSRPKDDFSLIGSSTGQMRVRASVEELEINLICKRII